MRIELNAQDNIVLYSRGSPLLSLSRAEALALAAHLQTICYEYPLRDGRTLKLGRQGLFINDKEYPYSQFHRCIARGPQEIVLTNDGWEVLSLRFITETDTEYLARFIEGRMA